MKVIGICTECHRTRPITVRAIAPRPVQTGVCTQCADDRPGARQRQTARPLPAPPAPVTVAPGDRIELISMPDDPSPIERGTLGTVTFVNTDATPTAQIQVDWDNGRTLMLLQGVDHYRRRPSTADMA